MHDSDKILEAEQSIQNIAAELKRMRNAAQILEDSQEKSNAILKAADRVIAETKEFSHACGDIIVKLSATDLAQRLDTLEGEINRIAGLINEQTKNTNDAIAATQSQLTGLEVALQAVAKESKKRYTISIVFIILTLATAVAALVTTLFRGVG